MRGPVPSLRVLPAVLILACGDPSGPPDDVERESFALTMRGDVDRDLSGVAHFIDAGSISIDDQPALPAEWISLVVAPPLGTVDFDLTANFIVTAADVGIYTVSALGPGNELPAPGVWVSFTMDLLDGTTAGFVSQSGTVTVSGRERGEIWGELEVSFTGYTTTAGVSTEASVSVAGRFRANMR